MRGLLLIVALAVFALPVHAQRPETEVLPASEYRGGLEEVVVEGRRAPAWRDRLEQEPRWDRPRIDIPEVKDERIEWMPAYTREEREDYERIRDRERREPRIRLFDIEF